MPGNRAPACIMVKDIMAHISAIRMAAKCMSFIGGSAMTDGVPVLTSSFETPPMNAGYQLGR